MSILQEYVSIKKTIGKEKYNQILKFLKYHPHYNLSDVYYNERAWCEMENWVESEENKA